MTESKGIRTEFKIKYAVMQVQDTIEQYEAIAARHQADLERAKIEHARGQITLEAYRKVLEMLEAIEASEEA